MRVQTLSIPVSTHVDKLPALVVEPDSNVGSAPVLLFLHGKGEAGASPNELPLVCLHQTPPFQAVLGRVRGTLIIAPQAPPLPSKDEWNWRDYVVDLARFIATKWPKRRVLATGFSRGGLGVLQLLEAHPGLVQRWALVDPQPARDQIEMKRILPCPKMGREGWLRYGVYRNKDERWREFSTALGTRLPKENCNDLELKHDKMALEAYCGSALAADPGVSLYHFLGVEFNATQ